jgi:hypothetical protein
MKKILIIAAVLASMNAWAKDSQRLILADAKTFITEVSTTTVRCSDLGYGNLQLKINLSGLDGWTVFDHSNNYLGEFGEPCMTAGSCKTAWRKDGYNVADIVQDKPGSEVITVVRQLIESKTESKDEAGVDVCIRSLTENINTTVRGIKFAHTRSGADQTFHIEVCRK